MKIDQILSTDNDKTTLIIRLVVGYIFIMEGIQKFVYSDSLGAGRFIKIGIPYPEIMAPFVGFTEIVCGSLFIIGFLIRFAAIPSLIIMITALATTKLSLIYEKGILTFSHDARNDLLMFSGCLFLLIKGSGAFGLDQLFKKGDQC